MRTWTDHRPAMRSELPMFASARSGDLSSLRAQISGIADLEMTDPGGNTLLMVAACHGHRDSVEFLLESGASPNARDLSGNTALMGASFRGHVKVVESLLRSGADPEIRNPSGQCALDYAAMFGRSAIIPLLVPHETPRAPTGFRKFLSTLNSLIVP